MNKAISRHPMMKTLSFLVAVGLWWVVHEEQVSEANFVVKVQVKNLPEGLMAVGAADSEIQIKVVGPRSKIKRIREQGFPSFEIDLSDGRQGVRTYDIYGEDFHVPRGVRVTRIIPQRINIQLDQAEERLVRVDPKFVGTLDDGFEMIGAEITPPYVKVKAARSELEDLSVLKTQPISLSDRLATFEGVYSVLGFRPNWILSEKKVAVKVQISEREISKILSDVPVNFAGLDRPVNIEPKRVALRITGLAGKVSAVMEEKPAISIDGKALGLGRLGKNSYRIRPAVPKRPGVEITMIPDSVRVTLD